MRIKKTNLAPPVAHKGMALALLDDIPMPYRAAAHVYRMNGCDDGKTAKALGIHVETLRGWKRHGQWDAWAAACSVEDIADEFEAHGEHNKQIIRQARDLTSRMMDAAQQAFIALEVRMEQGELDDFALTACASLGKTAIESAARLHGWAQRVEVEATVKIDESVKQARERLLPQLLAYEGQVIDVEAEPA